MIEGFSDIPDEELDRYKLDRWFVRGARELLRADAPRRAIRWLRSSDSIPSVLGFDPREARLGIVERERTGETYRLDLVPGYVGIDIMAFCTRAGVLLWVLRLSSKKSVPIERCMEVNHLLAHANDSHRKLVLVPPSLARTVGRPDEASPHPAAPPKKSSFSADELSTALGLGATANDEPQGEPLSFLRSLPNELCRRVALSRPRPEEGVSTSLAFYGRTPIFAHLSVDPEELASFGERAPVLEGLAARCQRHPDETDVRGLAPPAMQGPSFTSFPVTGTQRFHVSCEGVVVYGQLATEFDRSTWPTRVGREYLLTYLIALHQSVVCQLLSWRSQRRLDDPHRTEQLMLQLQEYLACFEATVLSNQVNIQRLYSACRFVTKTKEVVDQLQREVRGWQELEFSRDRRFFNALGVLGCLYGFMRVANEMDQLFIGHGGTSGGPLVVAHHVFAFSAALGVLALLSRRRRLRLYVRRIWEGVFER